MGKKSVKNTTPTINDHEEMFLAKIAGENIEMPEVTNHKEIWLKRIAENSGGGSDVIINPTLAGTEANATGIEVDGTKYKISEVKANPTLAGTEENLTGVEVDGTKYKVPETKKLYYHLVGLNDSTYLAYLNIISSRQTAYISMEQIAQDLYFDTDNIYPFPACGQFAPGERVNNAYFEENKDQWTVVLSSGTSAQSRITAIENDTVTEI